LLPISQLAKSGVDKKITEEYVKSIITDVTKIEAVNKKLLSLIEKRLEQNKDVDTLIISDIFLGLVRQLL
jgi:hypothetical protein